MPAGTALYVVFAVLGISQAAVWCIFINTISLLRANRDARAERGALCVVWAVVGAIFAGFQLALIRSQRRRHCRDARAAAAWLPCEFLVLMLLFSGLWISLSGSRNVDPGAEAGAAVIVCAAGFAPVLQLPAADSIGPTIIGRVRLPYTNLGAASALTLLHTLFSLSTVLRFALEEKGWWVGALAAVAVLHFSLTAAVPAARAARAARVARAAATRGGDAAASVEVGVPLSALAVAEEGDKDQLVQLLATGLHLIACIAIAIVSRVADPAAAFSSGAIAAWGALLVGTAAHYATASDVIYPQRASLSIGLLLASYWTGRYALLATMPLSTAAWCAAQMPWWRARVGALPAVGSVTNPGTGAVGAPPSAEAGDDVGGAIAAPPSPPPSPPPSAPHAHAEPVVETWAAVPAAVPATAVAEVCEARWYERSIAPPIYITGQALCVISFVVVDWFDHENGAPEPLLATRALLLLLPSLAIGGANRRRAVAGDPTHAPACTLAAMSIPLLGAAALAGGDGSSHADAACAIAHTCAALALLGAASCPEAWLRRGLRPTPNALAITRIAAYVTLAVFAIRLNPSFWRHPSLRLLGFAIAIAATVIATTATSERQSGGSGGRRRGLLDHEVLGSLFLFFVAATRAALAEDDGSCNGSDVCGAYPLLSLVPAIPVAHALVRCANAAPSRHALLPHLTVAAALLALTTAPYSVAVWMNLEGGVQGDIHSVTSDGFQGVPIAPIALSFALLAMQLILLAASFRPPKGDGSGGGGGGGGGGFFSERKQAVVEAAFALTLLGAMEVAMPLALAPAAAMSVALARRSRSLVAAFVATLCFLLRGLLQLFNQLYGLPNEWWACSHRPSTCHCRRRLTQCPCTCHCLRALFLLCGVCTVWLCCRWAFVYGALTLGAAYAPLPPFLLPLICIAPTISRPSRRAGDGVADAEARRPSRIDGGAAAADAGGGGDRPARPCYLGLGRARGRRKRDGDVPLVRPCRRRAARRDRDAPALLWRSHHGAAGLL